MITANMIDAFIDGIESKIIREWRHDGGVYGCSSGHIDFVIDGKEYILLIREVKDEEIWAMAGNNSCECISELLEAAKTEAIKEFAERLKDIVDEPALIRGRVIDTIIARIDNLVKETTGERYETTST